MHALRDQRRDGPLDESHFASAKETTAKLNADGFRVIAVAFKEMPPTQAAYSVADEADLTLAWLHRVPRSTEGDGRRGHRHAEGRGVQVKILTGDNDIVTRKICHEVGLRRGSYRPRQRDRDIVADDSWRTWPRPRRCSPRSRRRRRQRSSTPCTAKGHVVGFMGDGINDGPALKAADVGISVDSAVDIAKDSADIILLEKSLAVLGDGVLEGRKVFGNITKYIKMGASSNFGNMFSVLGASIFLPFLPMAPIQVLTNNLLYDFSQTTIPTDNVDAEYLAVPRRWDIGNIVEVRAVHRPDQLDLRLCHVFPDALRLQRLEQSRFVPDRLVRRVPAHPDAHHPHHPHGEDSVS